MKRIDAHQHFWRYTQGSHDWIEPGSVLACDRLPADVRPAMDACGLSACIAVQACHTAAETDWLLSLSAAHPWIAGVVGWVDLASPDLSARLDQWNETRLVGIRHIVQDEADPEFLLRDTVITGVRTIVARGLAYDILVRAPQWACLPRFLDAVGEGSLILDHGGKPQIAAAGWQPWADMIRAVAQYPGVVCKLSGLVTEADHRRWTADDISRYLDHLFAMFGPERLMFGSDWPVCQLAADYARVTDLIEAFVARACPDYREAIFGITAAQTYNLEDLT